MLRYNGHYATEEIAGKALIEPRLTHAVAWLRDTLTAQGWLAEGALLSAQVEGDMVLATCSGRDDDFRVLNYGTSGKTNGKSPHRLSNTNNPLTFGSAESLTQLLVSLMPVSDGANSIFADEAQALISGVMYALVDLRDKGLNSLPL